MTFSHFFLHTSSEDNRERRSIGVCHTYLRGFSVRPVELCLLLLFEDSVEDVHQQRIEGIHVSLCADVTVTAAGNALASQHPSALPTLQYNQISVTTPQLQEQIHHNKYCPDGIPIVVKLHRMLLFPLFCSRTIS